MGYPDKSTAIRATLRLSSPAWLAHPKSTSSIAAGSKDGFFSNNPFNTCAAKSSARTAANVPAKFPIAVLTHETIYASFILFNFL